jgi:Multidrug resistance efflux pump
VKTFISLLALAALLFGMVSCRPKRDANVLQLSGSLEMTEHGVGMPVPGRLASLLVDEGDEVKNGQLLATLERYDQAARDYNRLVQLLARGGANQQAVEQAELAMREQRALAPVDGVVLTKVHETGEVVGGSSPVLILGDRERLWVRVFIPEGEVSRVEMNAPATLRVDGLDRDFKGHVSFISSQAEFTPRNVQTPEERVTQTFAVKITLNEKEPYLRPGVSAEVTLPLREAAPQ